MRGRRCAALLFGVLVMVVGWIQEGHQAAILRLYGPLETWFEQTWRPGDIEPIAT